MQWNNHSHDVPEGAHAFLGASQHAWLNYSEEKLAMTYRNRIATLKGTKLHAIAALLIKNNIKLPKTQKTFNMYVNDAIGYKMRPEQPLYYSENCFGTADAISFKKKLLRIHDLKTGVNPASLHQLEIYAALFCLEYNVKPGDIDIEIRIYQNDDVQIGYPPADVILPIMDKIIRFDKIIETIKEEQYV